MKRRPYVIPFALAAAAAIGAAVAPTGTLDFHLHDTYLIVDYRSLYIALAGLLLLTGLLYLLFRNMLLSSILTWIHLLSLLVFLSVLLFSYSSQTRLPEAPRRYLELYHWQRVGDASNLLALSLLIGALAFSINMLGGIIVRIFRRR